MTYFMHRIQISANLLNVIKLIKLCISISYKTDEKYCKTSTKKQGKLI